MPVNGLHLVSVRRLVTGKNAELKRLDGMSEKPGINSFTRVFCGMLRVKQDSNKVCLKRSLWINLARLQPGVQSSAKNRNLDAGTAIRLRQVGVEELFQLTLGQCADFGGRYFAVFEQQQGWDAANAVLRRGARVLVDVQLSYGQFALILFSDLIQNRRSFCTDHTTLPRNRRGSARQP